MSDFMEVVSGDKGMALSPPLRRCLRSAQGLIRGDARAERLVLPYWKEGYRPNQALRQLR